jgi:hypothetical protein
MVIYVIDRGASNYTEPCVACGVVGQPDNPDSWAYDEDESLLGWICEDCFKGGSDYMKDRLRERARDLHRIACNKDRLADDGIRYAGPEASPAIP